MRPTKPIALTPRFIRCVGENGLTTEVEDLAHKLAITSNGATVYAADLSGANLLDRSRRRTNGRCA